MLKWGCSLWGDDIAEVEVCPCGQQKAQYLSCIKVDADQFFKSASTKRTLDRTADLFARLRRKKNACGVAVKTGKASSGFICSPGRRIPTGYTYLAFEEIEAGMRFAAQDDIFRLGDKVFQRKKGWPMGGSASPVATAIDLAFEVHDLHRSRKRLREVGWKHKSWHAKEIVCGIQHVDDVWVASKVWCPNCLFAGMGKLWPKDVGVSPEGSGPTLVFLHTLLHVEDSLEAVPVRVFPSPYNPDFARGLRQYPEVGRIPPFFSPRQQTWRLLAQHFTGRFTSFDKTLQGRAEETCTTVAEVVAESLLLDWPPRHVSCALRAFPRRQKSQFAVSVRMLGTQLRRRELPHKHAFLAVQCIWEQCCRRTANAC